MPISILSTSNIPNHPGYTPGEYYLAGSFWGGATNNTGILTNANIRYHPVIFHEDVIVDRLALSVAGAVASAQARLAIFNPSASTKGKPGSLLVKTAFLDCSTTGIKAGVIADTVLKAGVYYIASFGGTTSPNIHSCNSSIYTNYVGDNGASGDFTNFWAGYTQSGTFSDFPSQAGTLAVNRIVPVVKFRVKP